MHQIHLNQFENAIENFYTIYRSDPLIIKDKFVAVCNSIRKHTKIPDDPYDQLYSSIEAVFSSWNNAHAIKYREYNNIGHNTGTAVIVQEMVFGNYGSNSGSGVIFSRHPSTGKKEMYGEYLKNAQGDDLVSGLKTPENINSLKQENSNVYDRLYYYMERLENHFKDMQEIEFTYEEDRLYILQTRTGKRTKEAANKIAYDMLREKLIGAKEYAARIAEPKKKKYEIDERYAENNIVTNGIPSSPGVVVGKVIFSNHEAVALAQEGESIVLVRNETTAGDIDGLKAASGIVTVVGGVTSHAAVVARAMGISCITGCTAITINGDEGYFDVLEGKKRIKKMETITIDGTSGEIYFGDVTKFIDSIA